MEPNYKNLNLMVAGDGSGIYIDRSELEAKMFRSEHPHEAVTLDFDAHGNLIGVEVLATPLTGKPKSDSL